MSSVKSKVAVLDDYQHVAQTINKEAWTSIHERADVTVFDDTLQADTQFDALIDRLKPFDVICSMRERTKFNVDVLNALPNLKMLTTTAMGNRAIDVPAAAKAGILVAGTSYSGQGTLEHTWALILASVRRLVVGHIDTINSNPQWQTTVPFQLAGKTMAVVGLGNLGKGVAKIAQAFQMEVQAWSPNLTQERADEAGVKLVSKEQLFATSDVISVNIVLSDSTIDLVKYKELSSMKPTAFIINTSRGPIINEKDLIRALDEEKLAGAGLDVFDIEPLPLDAPIRKAKNVTLTPHMGYVGRDLYEIFWSETAQNVLGYLDDKIDKSKLITKIEVAESRAGRN